MSLIVVSNREPYSPVKEGSLTWKPAIGGLTAALDPVLTKKGGRWIAWGSGEKSITEVGLPPEDPKYTLDRLNLSDKELADYYYGFSNKALWPLSHYFLGRVQYLNRQWKMYEKVNQKFADLVVEKYKAGDLIWIHDYQLALVPKMIREQIPDAKIGFFWHIPWPSSEVFRTLPWDKEILEGILGADIIGVHTSEYARHFRSCARIALKLPNDGHAIDMGKRKVRVEAHPIGIETDVFENLANSPEIIQEAQRLRSTFPGQIMLGVDRLDYTKGIPERLKAYGDFLGKYPSSRGAVSLIQIAVPSRELVDSYRKIREQTDALVGRINGTYGTSDWTPIHYVTRGLSREELAVHYLAADVLIVTPLRDGLNLVAKEFASVSQNGILMLSEFAGAAEEMPEAVMVNPFDHDGLVLQIKESLNMSEEERTQRIQALKERLRGSDLSSWTENFINAMEAS